MKTITEFKDLEGEVITKFENTGDSILITLKTGEVYQQYHDQDCCESVQVEDIVGDIDDVLDSEITEAEEVTSRDNPDDVKKEYQESFTWTFYKLGTRKGNITIRWYGESNGYYSESVTFNKTP